jgi:hypothetical protein
MGYDVGIEYTSNWRTKGSDFTSPYIISRDGINTGTITIPRREFDILTSLLKAPMTMPRDVMKSIDRIKLKTRTI